MDIKIGDVIKVGKFFWIDEDDFIGYDSNAKHGHGLDKDRCIGSANNHCSVEVRGFLEGKVVFSLMRPETPYGAEAPIGTVFMIDREVIEKEWWECVRSAEREKQRKALAEQFCK